MDCRTERERERWRQESSSQMDRHTKRGVNSPAAKQTNEETAQLKLNQANNGYQKAEDMQRAEPHEQPATDTLSQGRGEMDMHEVIY